MLSADEEFWDLSSSTVAGTATMARRVRMHCEESSATTDEPFLEHNASTSRYVTPTEVQTKYTNLTTVFSCPIYS
jgi:hypothetical protein